MMTSLVQKATSFIRATLTMLSYFQQASEQEMKKSLQPIPIPSEEARRDELRRRQAQYRRTIR